MWYIVLYLIVSFILVVDSIRFYPEKNTHECLGLCDVEGCTDTEYVEFDEYANIHEQASCVNQLGDDAVNTEIKEQRINKAKSIKNAQIMARNPIVHDKRRAMMVAAREMKVALKATAPEGETKAKRLEYVRNGRMESTKKLMFDNSVFSRVMNRIKAKVAFVMADFGVGTGENCQNNAAGIPECCTYDFSEDVDISVFVGLEETVGAWSVLCDGATIVSKQTRKTTTDAQTGIAEFDMGCWDGSKFANSVTKATGDEHTCSSYRVLVGSQTNGELDPCANAFTTANITADVGANTASGVSVTFTCQAGYESSGQATCTNGTWDQPTCDATLCGANEFVSNHVCEDCADGTTNAAGDDASGSDTHCVTASVVCIHPDVTVHVLVGVSSKAVAVGSLEVGDLVIGEGRTSTVKRVERFKVEDEACLVPKDLCGVASDDILVSQTHAVRCPSWPTNTWTFCQPDWERVPTSEYVHVELESYLDDHLLSGSVVLESWDGYARAADTIEEACDKQGCPWPHKWAPVGDNRWTRVDLRQVLFDSSPHLRIEHV